MTERFITIDQFLTPEEIERAAEIYREHLSTTQAENYAARIDREIISPNIERINKALGQANVPRYLAYCVEYVMMQLGEAGKVR